MTLSSMDNATKGYVVVPFFATAAVFFLVFSILLVMTGSQILGHYFQPKVLAIVHTLALGWGTMIIFGAAYQLVPVIFEQTLFSPKLALFSYFPLTVGSCLLIHSFWNFRTDWILILGGSLVCLASYIYFLIIWMTSKNHEKSFEFNLFFMFSAFWLCFTTTVGLLLAINLGHHYISKNHLDILKLHAHAGLAGWFLQLILGAGAKMIPMFVMGKSIKRKALFISVTLINTGLIMFLVHGYRNQVDYKLLLCGTLILAGVISWGVFIQDCLKNRLRKKIEIPIKHSLLSIGSLFAAFASLPLVINQESGNWITLYMVWIFLGWITGIILGMTFKTLPFIIWNIQYKNLNGMANVPMPKDLYSHQLLKVQYILFLAGLSLTVLAVGFKIKWLITVSSILWVLLSVSYLMNVLKVLTHKRKEEYGS